MIKKGIIILLSTLCFACGRPDQSQHHTSSKSVDVKEEKNIIQEHKNTIKTKSSFDWSKFHHLKMKFLFKLKKQETPEDQVIMRFLEDYTLLENEYNSVLHTQTDYEVLNTLAYAEDGKIAKKALVFQKKVEENGFFVAQEEGMIYLSKNPQFLQGEILELVNLTSQKFLKLYCAEIDSICCSDAGIVISTKTLINRIYEWGELSKNTQNTQYDNMVKGKLKRNLYLLFQGLENTPTFDWTSKKIDQEIFDQMNELIKKYPNSLAAKEFQIYVDLLNQEGLKNTVEVKKFLQQKFN